MIYYVTKIIRACSVLQKAGLLAAFLGAYWNFNPKPLGFDQNKISRLIWSRISRLKKLEWFLQFLSRLILSLPQHETSIINSLKITIFFFYSTNWIVRFYFASSIDHEISGVQRWKMVEISSNVLHPFPSLIRNMIPSPVVTLPLTVTDWSIKIKDLEESRGIFVDLNVPSNEMNLVIRPVPPAVSTTT